MTEPTLHFHFRAGSTRAAKLVLELDRAGAWALLESLLRQLKEPEYTTIEYTVSGEMHEAR